MKLVAVGPQVSEPWLWQLARDFDVKVNIVRAQVDPDAGWIEVEMEGSQEDVQRAIAWLHTTGLHVDPKQRSIGA